LYIRNLKYIRLTPIFRLPNQYTFSILYLQKQLQMEIMYIPKTRFKPHVLKISYVQIYIHTPLTCLKKNDKYISKG
jgi:hypothetical protein